MGENLFLLPNADTQLKSQLDTPPRFLEQVNGAVGASGEEEPYTIKCICGFVDDDGHTVLCEQCNTWQHIDCYYYPTLVVPEVHKCVDCLPRILDSTGAAQRQRLHREPLNSTDDRRVRRPPSKSHKKVKTKDPNHTAVQQNGWPQHENLPADGRNGVSHDQPPPAKRPKTSHKHSLSLSSSALPRLPGPRERNGSNAPFAQSPAKALADCPADYFSPEFIRIHQENTDFTPAHANTHLNIGVTNLLSRWLDDVDAFAEATQGRKQGEIFKFFPEPIEDLETPIQKHRHEDDTVVFHGSHPVWPYLTVDKDIFVGDMIGEVRGTIGRLEEYQDDPANEWNRLRHPDHFVFFHPVLPIYIDCRMEGTLLRYARRSCRPNMKMETIITGEREYRFCFTANTDIPKGTEITVNWDLKFDTHLQDCLLRHSGSKPLTIEDKAYLHNSIETLLAHFGGCACEGQPEICLMEHFDQRIPNPMPESIPRQVKPSRKRKSSKRSPPAATLEGDSRAGSEVLMQDEEHDDTRSSSDSTRSKTSREQTPTNIPSHLVTGSAKKEQLSERERKKLLQSEMLFTKLEQEKQQGPRKKKRNSGSNVNTPAVSTSKQFGRANSIASNPNTPAPSARARGVNNTSYFNHGHTPSDQSPQPHGSPRPLISRASTVHQSLSPAKPEYVDRGMQTEAIDDAWNVVHPPTLRKPYLPLSKLLLRRSHLRSMPKANDAAPELDGLEDSLVNEPAPGDVALLPPPRSPIVTEQQSTLDVEMKDAYSPPVFEGAIPVSPGFPNLEMSSTMTQTPLQSSHPPIKPPAPPWPSTPPSIKLPQQQPRTNIRSANLHVDLPPPPLHSYSSVESQISATPGVLSASEIQTPLTAGATSTLPYAGLMPAPSLTLPTSLKKKMSLSDYTAKLKAKTPGGEKTPGFGEPGSSSPATVTQLVAPPSLHTIEQVKKSPSIDPLVQVKEEDPMKLD